VQSLNAASGALQATNNNIANANTPGYTREVPILQEVALDFGNQRRGWVVLEGYQSVRDELVQTQIQQETSGPEWRKCSTVLNAADTAHLHHLDPGHRDGDVGLLFSSISSLSTDPASASSRQAVLTAGQNLATAFNTASNTLTSQQAGLNTQVTQDVSQINQLTQQIAALNPQINAAEGRPGRMAARLRISRTN
jgi:flagellar hook-associated protein 1